MKEQKYKLRNVESFELRDIFECGQCFRWTNKKMEATQEYLKIMC